MKASEMVGLSIDIVRTYYQNDLALFFAYLDEDTLWFGPAKGQFLSGRQAILDAWKHEEHSLTFSVGNIRADSANTHPSYCEVMLSFPVTTHYPNGESIPVDQIIHITWCERKTGEGQDKQPRMLVIHISNLYHQHESDISIRYTSMKSTRAMCRLRRRAGASAFAARITRSTICCPIRSCGSKALFPADTRSYTLVMKRLK